MDEGVLVNSSLVMIHTMNGSGVHLFLTAGSLIMIVHHHTTVVSKKGPTLLLSSHIREGAHDKGKMRERDEEADGSRGLAYDHLSLPPIYKELLHESPNGSFLMGIGFSSNNH